MKFAALNNKDSQHTVRLQTSEKKTTKEAQESGCLQRYHEAIRLQQNGDMGGAKALYYEILGSKVMDEADTSSGMLVRLKFLIFKNLGTIARNHGDDSAALDAFIQAVGVDNSDVTVWYHLAKASCNLGNLLLSRTALEEARRCHGQYWPAIDLLCTVLYSLQDYSSCLHLINDVLKHCPQFPRGLAYLHSLAEISPDLLTFLPSLRLQLMKPRPPDTKHFIEEALQLSRRRGLLSEVKVLDSVIKPPKPLAYYSLYSLGQSLITIYHHCQELNKKTPSLAIPIDLEILCSSTNNKPLLPTLTVTQQTECVDTAAASSCEEGGSDGGRRPDGKKKASVDMTLLPKRRSTRVRTKREQVSPSEHFARFLPSTLRGCEFGDVCGLSPLPSSGHAPPSFLITDQSDCSILETAPRLSDDIVKSFLQENKINNGIIGLMYNYVLMLAQHYTCRWGEVSYPAVVQMFLEVYELIQSHLVLPSPLCSQSDPEYLSVQDIAMINLCYSELKLDSLQRQSSHTHSPPPLLTKSLSFSQLACSGGERERKGMIEYTLRVYWCLYKMKTLYRDMTGAIIELKKCIDVMKGSSYQSHVVIVLVPNLRQDCYISLDQVSCKMKSMEQVIASEIVYELYQSGDHTSVVMRLRPMLEWKSDDNYSMFLIGGNHGDEKQSLLSLLLSSLLSLNKRKECVECCVCGLRELLLCYKLGNKKWIIALRDTYNHLHRCLDNKDGVKIMREYGDQLRRHLVVCIFKTLDLHMEMMESNLLSYMPICIPWTILYITLISVWENIDDNDMETSTENIDVAMDTEPSVAMVTDKETIKQGSSLSLATDREGGSMVAMGTNAELGVQFLCVCHEWLGSMCQGWCVKDDGCLLNTMVVRLRKELRQLTAHCPKTREALLRELEQCYYCLYGHPHKKAKVWGLQEHGAEQLPLTWGSAQVLLEFYHPSFLPAVEENRALTPELVVLYRRLVEVIPDTEKVLQLSVIAEYIEGKIESLPFPSPPTTHTTLISEIFYLLADDALKSNEYFTALQNYIQSLCYCPERVDTWAGLALARARNILKKMDRRDVRGGMESVLQKQLTPILRCFKRALALGSQHRYISEKYGLFCYTVQSFCSQIMSQSDVSHNKHEVILWAERSRRGLLQLAQQCFNASLSEVSVAGGVARSLPWFYSLIAAKAGMKLGLPPSKTLPVLIKVAKQLSSGETTPPLTVELRGLWMTSVEVHYQIFSCALKYVMRDEGSEVSDVLGNCKELPLWQVDYNKVMKWIKTVLKKKTDTTPSQYGTAQSMIRDTASQYGTTHYGMADAVTLLVHKVIAEAEKEVAMETIETTPPSILEQCVYGIALCSIRCPPYYKPLYRLASTFHSLGQSQVAQSLLLGPIPDPMLKAQEKLLPLFVLRPNIFANFWQIPVEEINRPGRFSSYACASVRLLCNVLSQQRDSSSLLLLAQYLRTRPDSSRQYLRDYERVAMCQKAIQCCSTVHVQLLRDTHDYSQVKLKSLLLEIYSLRGLAQRTDTKQHTLSKEVDDCLVKCYNNLESLDGGGVVSTKVGVASLDEAVKYCQLSIRQQTDKSFQV